MLNSIFSLLGDGMRSKVDFHNGIACEDCGEVWVVPWDTYKERINAFSADETIQGIISISNSGGSDPWIEKITLVFTQYVHYLDPYIDNEMVTVTVDLSSSIPGLPGTLSSLLSSSAPQSQELTLEVPFNFTLYDHIQDSDRHLIFESYNGNDLYLL